MRFSAALFFTFLCTVFFATYASDHTCKVCLWCFKYNGQTFLDQMLVDEVRDKEVCCTCVESFLKTKSSPNAFDRKGNTLLHNVLGVKSENRLSLIKTILEYKGDVNIHNSDKRTPFHHLCHYYYNGSDYNEIVKCFLEAGGDPNIENNLREGPFILFVKNYVKVISIDKDVLNTFIKRKANLSYLLERSLKDYQRDHIDKKSSDKKEIFELISFLIESKADFNAINKIYIYSQDAFSPKITQFFLNSKMDPTTCCKGSRWVEKKFGYEWTHNAEKRNMLAYAIPLHVKKHYMPKWEALLLCLNAKQKTSLAFKIPKYLKMMFFGAIFTYINLVIRKIQKLEEVTTWSNEPNTALSLSLRNNIRKLIDMHNKTIQKTKL